MDKDDEEKIQKAIEEQITRALAAKKEVDQETVYTELHRGNEEEKSECRGDRNMCSSCVYCMLVCIRRL